MDVSNDFVHPYTTSDIASFVGLVLQLIWPAFLHTLTRCQPFGPTCTFTSPVTHLIDSVWVAETPSLGNVRLPDFITSITTTTLGRCSAVAWATVPVGSCVVHLVQLVLKCCRTWAGNYLSSLGETCFDNIVRYITLSLATDVHNIDTEH